MSELLYPYGFIYETTCTVNNMKYRGSHRRNQDPNDPDDSWYLGSPTNPQFWEDLEEYGRDSFVREILEDVDADKKTLKMREGFYLKQVDAKRNPIYYNRSNSAEYGGGATEGMKIMHRGEVHKYFTEDSIESALSEGWELGLSAERRESNPMKDPDVCKKFFEKNQHVIERFRYFLNNDNPMNSEESRKKVAQSKLGKIWINNGEVQSYVDESELSAYLSSGYSLGMLKRSGRTDKSYDCICKVCGVTYKGGKYSRVCKTCYSKMKSNESLMRYSKGENKNEEV